MSKDYKKPKLKGYGVYWTGDIKNKHIARKNQQYIRDQKYLHKYKKLKDSHNGEESSQQFDNSNNQVDNLTYDSESVNIIRPQVETTYISVSDPESPIYHNDSDPVVDDSKSSVDVVEPIDDSNKKKGDAYSKALKKRKEIEKHKNEEYNKKVEEIKKRKKEIRAKKQKRYERHRLLGARTKKGQPIMKNVIKHIMKGYKPD